MSSSLSLTFVTVDVFTSQPYGGNPLAIVRIPPGRTLTQSQKQAIAREFNLSETTFLHEHADDGAADQWTVDIFTTAQELPFAGHPTVGTACYVLGQTARQRGRHSGVLEASFTLQAGSVRLAYDCGKKTARAEIPHDVHIHNKRYTNDQVFALQPRLADAHHTGKITIKHDHPIVSIVKGMTFILVELPSVEALGLVSLAGQSLAAAGLDHGWDDTFLGTYFFVRAGASEHERDDGGGVMRLRTRMIEGPLEDPATGSAASGLAAYLSLMEGEGEGEGAARESRFEIVQGVEMGRRSEIFVHVQRSVEGGVEKVVLEGGAVQVMEGRLMV